MRIKIEQVGYEYGVRIYDNDDELVLCEIHKNVSVEYPILDSGMTLTQTYKGNNEDVA